MAARRTYRPVTLGNLADQGLAVWAWCNACFKNGAVATSTLIARLGRAFPVPDVGARMRCSCGSRAIETRPNWLDNLGAITRHTDAGIHGLDQPG
jgi:hypothetical protein